MYQYFVSGIDTDGETVSCDCRTLEGAMMFADGLGCWCIKNLAGDTVATGGF